MFYHVNSINLIYEKRIYYSYCNNSGSTIISVASYLGSSFEYRSKLNACEEIMREKADIKSAEFKKLVKLCKRQINLD